MAATEYRHPTARRLDCLDNPPTKTGFNIRFESRSSTQDLVRAVTCESVDVLVAACLQSCSGFLLTAPVYVCTVIVHVPTVKAGDSGENN